jgi:hypothetical protein
MVIDNLRIKFSCWAQLISIDRRCREKKESWSSAISFLVKVSITSNLHISICFLQTKQKLIYTGICNYILFSDLNQCVRVKIEILKWKARSTFAHNISNSEEKFNRFSPLYTAQWIQIKLLRTHQYPQHGFQPVVRDNY